MTSSYSESAHPTSAEITARPARLMSLDALRGFDMFWIVGGGAFVQAVATALNPEIGEKFAVWMEHPEWNGYEPWDQIFPLFMFIAGAAMPFSFARQAELGTSRAAMHWKVIRRGLLLVLLGMIYNGLLNFDFANQRYPSVLGRIGLGYLFAGLIVLNSKVRGQIVWIVALLVGYWAALRFVPVPEFGAGNWGPGNTLADYVDRMLIPGKLYQGVRDPEGLVSTIPSIATVLSGVLAGHWLRRTGPNGNAKTAWLLAAGVASALLGLACDMVFPINKNLWTSSFVLLTSGVSASLLALFYLAIDVWGFRKWAFPFVVIGMNAITVYLAREFIDFPAVFKIVFARAQSGVHPALLAGGEIFLVWLFAYVLYRARIFLRV